MRKFFTILVSMPIGILLTASLFLPNNAGAQSPEKMSYQAVIRDSDDNLITETQVGMQISILQDSESGTAVYVETQEPSTNANGLVSIEIGTGTTSYDFSTIDWANGPYFIKTETDPTGGTDYTITGTSELLSVPYALHSVSSDVLLGEITENQISDLQDYYFASNPDGFISDYIVTEGDITAHQGALEITESQISDLGAYLEAETDPVYSASVAGGINTSDTANWNNKQNELIAGAGIDITSNVVSIASTYYVGQLMGTDGEDGVVFYVDHTGQHGLICSPADVSASAVWSNITSTAIGASANSHFNGATNTAAIMGQTGHTNSAAKLCTDYSTPGTSAGDWYLPSIAELSMVYHSKYVINKAYNTNRFTDGNHWSSTEADNEHALHYNFFTGSSSQSTKSSNWKTIAVRAF